MNALPKIFACDLFHLALFGQNSFCGLPLSQRDCVCFSQSPHEDSDPSGASSLDAAVFDEQFAAYRSLLEKRARRRVGREDAEDIVGVCYVEARASLASYCPARNLAWWLLGILDNLLRTHARQSRVQREELYASDACPSDAQDTQTLEGARQEAKHLWLCRRLARIDLTARQYECVARALGGETQQYIADAMHISQRMVSYHLQAAAVRLKYDHSPDEGAEGGLSEYDSGTGSSESGLRENEPDVLQADRHALDFFCECARHDIYRKPHSFDNQSTSEERERRRSQCLRDDAKRQAGR